MVFCFSGTGNSRWVAEALSDRFRLSLINIGDGCGETSFRLNDEERLFFVFPIHAWSMPKLVRQFIRQVRIENYHGQPVDTIVTCGDDCGMADRRIRKAYGQRGWRVGQIVSIQMPNTYVPLFDVDDKALEQKKIRDASILLPELLDKLEQHQTFDYYIRTKASRLKTYVVHPLFNLLLIGDKKFATDGRCVGCGMCARACPVGNIRMQGECAVDDVSESNRAGTVISRNALAEGSDDAVVDKNSLAGDTDDVVVAKNNLAEDTDGAVVSREGRSGSRQRPQWMGHCTHCMGCYHVCPHHAVMYGKKTNGRGQYYFRNISGKIKNQ